MFRKGEIMVNQLLQNLIQHAYKTVPYYKRMFDDYGIDPETIKTKEDLPRLPVLTKEQIQESPDKFLSEDYLYYPKNKDLIICRTSGSTGKFLKIYWSKQDDIRSKFHLWRMRNKYYNIEPQDKFCSFHTTVYTNNKLVNMLDSMIFYNGRNLSFNKANMGFENIEEYYKKITEFKPKWLFIQPSIAFLIAEYLDKNNLVVPEELKYIELTGEYLFNNYRRRIEEVFKVKTANQYGCNEANCIAIECPYGHFHCMDKNVIVEIQNNGSVVNRGDEGEIIITCLTNTTMPFIRYAIGDRGILYEGRECDCGNRTSELELLSGRVSEYILSPAKEPLSCYIFLRPIESINSRMGNPIKQFQVKQNSLKKFTLIMSLRNSFNNWKDTICKEFKEETKALGFHNTEWEFIFCDCILPDATNGKLRFFINEMKEGAHI